MTDASLPSAAGPIVSVGVISDTHGLLRPEAVEALQGSELILHAGDVGDPEILETLEGKFQRKNKFRINILRLLIELSIVFLKIVKL